MKKRINSKKIRKFASVLLMNFAIIFGLTACQGTANEAEVDNTLAVSEQAQERTNEGGWKFAGGKQQGNNYMGEITAIEGNVITVTTMGGGQFPGGMVGKMWEGRNEESESSEDNKSDKKPQNSFGGNKMPDGEKKDWKMPNGKKNDDGENSKMPNGKMPGGGNFGENFKGESMTIEVSDDTAITINEEKAGLSDLNVGDIIQFTMDGDAVTAINIGMPELKTTEE